MYLYVYLKVMGFYPLFYNKLTLDYAILTLYFYQFVSYRKKYKAGSIF